MIGADLILACDPGVTGAICALDATTLDVRFFEMPAQKYSYTDSSGKTRKYRRIDDEALRDLIRSLSSPSVAVFVVESQSGFGPIPGVTKFGLGYCFGLLRGLILSTPMRLELVKSQTWKKHFKLCRTEGMSISKFKDQSRLLAIELFPAASEALRLKGSHNQAESLLIAEWARQNLLKRRRNGYVDLK